MKTRIIAGVIAAVGLTTLLFKGHPDLLIVVVLACATVGCLEFDKLFFTTKDWFRQARVIVLVLSTIFVMRDPYARADMVIWIAFLFLCVFHLFDANRLKDTQAAVRNLQTEVLGYFYVVGLFGFLLPIIQSGPMGRELLFLVFFIVFGGDTAAYFIGSRFGKRKLAPTISPGKSVEGAIASLFGSLLMALIWIGIFDRFQDPAIYGKILLFAPIGSILGLLGDLFESLLKRSQARKDSGSFLPGHGGMLDRLDNLLFICPAFYFYLKYF